MKNEWILSQLNFSNESKINTSLVHWVSKSDKDKIFPYEKFNIFIDIVNFSESDYNTYLNVFNSILYIIIKEFRP